MTIDLMNGKMRNLTMARRNVRRSNVLARKRFFWSSICRTVQGMCLRGWQAVSIEG